jgi:F-type H+-transporting ATPase subunit alpha
MLRIQLALCRELAAFAQFGSDLDDETQALLARGQRLIEVLKQLPNSPMPAEEQVLVLWAVSKGFFDKVDVKNVRNIEQELLSFVRNVHRDLLERLANCEECALDMLLSNAVGDFFSTISMAESISAEASGAAARTAAAKGIFN